MNPAPRRVVVVGAGLSGLSAAMHLRGAGCEVVVLEQLPYVGGLCHDLVLDGVRHESGPTVLTMPEILEAAFAALGSTMTSRLQLNRLDPAYRATYADGSIIEVRDTIAKTASSIEATCGSAEADRFIEFADYCARLYDVTFEPFMRRSFDSPFDLLSRPLLDLLRLRGFSSMGAQVNRRLGDPRTRRLVSFQALYAGLAPAKARALYNVITYMDIIAGVYSPIGGMSAITTAMAAALRECGVDIRTNTRVISVVRQGDRVTGVRVTGNETVAADAVVLTCDPERARELLDIGPIRRRLRRSPSCVLLHLNAPSSLAGVQAHHTIHFGENWDRTFSELIDQARPMSDPSVLVSAPAYSDPSRQSTGAQPLYVLLPCPNEQRRALGAHVVDDIVRTGLARLGERGLALEESMIHRVVSPAHWRQDGMRAGTPFSLAHTFAQTGPFRPNNRIRGLKQIALAGAGTVPGVGVPTSILSGELAAERLVGAAR